MAPPGVSASGAARQEVRLLPVQIAKPPEKPPAPKPSGVIEIELANGERIRVDAG